MLENVVCLWQYYNSALVPSCAPHEEADESVVYNKDIWKHNWHGYPFFARWTTCFDCGYKTEWWYCIKDTPYTIDTLTAKRRYIINKGRKNFDVRIIEPSEYAAELAKVQIAAFSAYLKAYKSQIDYNRQVYSFKQSTNNIFFAAFKKNTDILCGYSVLYPIRMFLSKSNMPLIKKYRVF